MGRLLQFLLVFGFLAAAGGGVVLAMNWKNSRNASKYLPLLNAAETKYGIPHDMLARVAYQESHFRDDVVSGQTRSSAGATGIMQLVPRFHPGVDPLNVAQAIDYAGKYLRSQYDRFHSWPLALAAYNAGPGTVADFIAGTNTSGLNPKRLVTGGIPPFGETQAYVLEIGSDVGLA